MNICKLKLGIHILLLTAMNLEISILLIRTFNVDMNIIFINVEITLLILM